MTIPADPERYPNTTELRVGFAQLHPGPDNPRGELVELDGERWYQISHYDAMPPFLMTVASDSDHWLFLSSTGGLTAGRRTPDGALFPYTTDDQLHDSAETAGPRTILRVSSPEGGARQLWEPFSSRYAGLHRTPRALAKSVRGNQVRFTEVNHDLRLAFGYQWSSSHQFGFVRQAWLVNEGPHPVALDVLDGLLNLMPAGLDRRFQQQFSTLADGYKDNEIDPRTGLGLYRLSSIPIDAAEPSEALLATTVWSAGLPQPTYAVSAAALERFRRGLAVAAQPRSRGQRGAYLVGASFELAPGARRDFYLVADVERDAAAVVSLAHQLTSRPALLSAVQEDVRRGSDRLEALVAAADGLQATADERQTARHFANVLYNCQRGGLPAEGYLIRRDDFARFLAAANRQVHTRQQGFLARLPERLPRLQLVGAAREQADPDLERLVHEYLPFNFSRRHGDPSRPWNQFAITVRDADDETVLDYQGNWRDLFQNWEALALSFPGYLPGMMFKFLDASTADGHNPYRVTRDGFEWEVPDPADAWAHIGYWGDHQVIYLLKLLELGARFQPGALQGLFGRRLFTYADVPYRIRPFEALVADAQDTIDFDRPAHERAERRAAELGAEGKTLLDGAGNPVRVCLMEKLLVSILARMANFIPGAGLWMNTQRPEWNDANNALVGNGASIVTLAYLRRHLAFVRELVGTTRESFPISAEVVRALVRMEASLLALEPSPDVPLGDQQRRVVLDALGHPWSDYRQRLYREGLSGTTVALGADAVTGLLGSALRHIDHTLRANRRPDGLYHAYNLVRFTGTGVEVRRLPVMLEGQVAMLSSGALDTDQALILLDSLRASALYRPDQESYLLYPDRRLPSFLDKNRLPPAEVEAIPWLLRAPPGRDAAIVVRDRNGAFHFHHRFRNARRLAEALDAAAEGPSPAERQQILDLYERTFDHHAFTGRSGTFYKYEGLGSIYWHMVSKLRLAVQETWQAALRAGMGPDKLRRLRQHYRQIRDGLGVHKPPALHGAIPTDPYSHTPGFAGAQQPGMTGQVKEDILCRLTELGLVVQDGRLTFEPALVLEEELSPRPQPFRYRDVHDQVCSLELPAGALAFTFCQVPIVVHGAGPAGITIERQDGPVETVGGLALDGPTSAQIFGRTGSIRRLDVRLALS